MAQPKADAITALSKDLLQAFDDLNGLHPGFRPAHAKGTYLSGTFTPSPAAASLTRAPHAQRASTPVTARFSDFAGFPTVADNDGNNASPRGLAVRFHLADHVHTDIIGHSVDGFPTRTGEEFLELLRAAHASGPDAPKPTPIEVFLGTHPKALEFVQTPKPIPSSFAKESFFSLTAFKFTNSGGSARYGRFRVVPDAAEDYLDSAAAAAKSPDFLFEEITARVAKEPVKMRILVQLAESGDIVNDSTIHWPADRQQIEFGIVSLTERIPDDDADARRIIFDPIPRVDGIDPSDDPLLDVRAALYLMSGRRRRAASSEAHT
jgi:catalase